MLSVTRMHLAVRLRMMAPSQAPTSPRPRKQSKQMVSDAKAVAHATSSRIETQTLPLDTRRPSTRRTPPGLLG